MNKLQQFENPNPETEDVLVEFNKQFDNALTLLELINYNSEDEIIMMHGIRISVLRKVIYLMNHDHMDLASELFSRLKKELNNERIPYGNEALEPTYIAIQERLNQN